MTIIDITIPLNTSIPSWPGSTGFNIYWSKRLDAGDECNNSFLKIDSHVGTHIDAPYHFIGNGITVERLALDALIGPCSVVYLPEIREISSSDLSKSKIAKETSRLLIRTDNSELWSSSSSSEFKKDFVHLSPDAAQWIVQRRIQLVGIDYLSVGSYDAGVQTHKILLEAGVIALEGLNLHNVTSGEYELICLPLKIEGAEGAPVRAVLRRM